MLRLLAIVAWLLAPPPNLHFFHDLYTFRGEDGRTAIVAAYAVPAGELEAENAGRRVRYRFVVSLILADTAAGSVSRTDDSVTVFLPRVPRDDHLLRTHLEVQARPSWSTLQRVIITDATTPGIGRLYGGAFPIPDYRGRELMLSDIAFAELDDAGGWERGGVTLALIPTGRVPHGFFNLYYEVYNLPAGHPYTTDIMVERAGGPKAEVEGGEGVAIRFAGKSTAGRDGTLAELRAVQARLPGGRYRLTVTITDTETGKTARRSRPFIVPET